MEYIKSKPRISVIMPVYNCEDYVAESLESILSQSFPDFELIAVDGGSKDRTPEIIREFKDDRIRIFTYERRTPLIESLNDGIMEARGSLIARQDADDISSPDRLAKQCRRFEADNSLAVLGTYYVRIDRSNKPVERKVLRKHVGFLDLKQGNQLCHGSIMFRRNIVLDEGLYDPLFRTCEDYELFCRLSSRNYKIENIPEFLYCLRVHEISVSESRWQEQILRSSLVREVYYGRLTKNRLKSIPQQDLKHLYGLLSLDERGYYHVSSARRYLKSRKYLDGIAEVLDLVRLDPKIFRRYLRNIITRPGILRTIF